MHLVPAHKPLPRLNAEEWARLHGKFREWFSLVGGADRLRGLDKWEKSFCRLLEQPAERPGWLRRRWWKRLSLRRGRRGRYSALRLLLTSAGEKNHS